MPSFTVFRPSTAFGSLVGGAVVLVTMLVGFILVLKGLTMRVSFDELYPLVAGGFFVCTGAVYAYWTWSCRTLRYVVDRNALSIRWGGLNQVVPLANIERLLPAAEDENPDIEGVNWPGHHIGKAQVEDLGEVLFYSAHRSMSEVLYVQTPTETYAISLSDPVFFAQTVQSNQSRGPLFEQRQVVHRWGIAAQSFWLDPTARLLSLVLVGSFIVVMGYVFHIYPGLSQSVPLRFPSFAGIVRVADKSDMLDIPRSAAGFLAFDLVLAIMLHTWERMVGYVLLLAGIVVQIMLLIAAIVAVA